EGHNDIVGIALVLTALACRRRTVLAIVLVALAGAVKLPFLAIGVVVFASAPTLRSRLVPAGIALFAGLGLSCALGGREYFWAMHRTTELYAQPIVGYDFGAHVVLGTIGLLALATAVVARRFYWGVPWSFNAFGQFTLWHYLGWGIPYAVLDETQGVLYLALLPVAGFEVNNIFDNTPLFDVSRLVLLTALVVAFIFSLRRWSRSRRTLSASLRGAQ
ncbi:MAG: hypothetical protein IAI49_00720, partial [Candidatus Eremiobacteraeota bacterium]|nr:hypothetical protein [Candidatus Eremiobacteraeota bacterium]